MTNPVVPGTFQVRRHTAAEWTSLNSILLDGEQGLETDTLKTKFGQGGLPWNSLAYTAASGGVTVINNLTSTNPAQALAASQGPAITDQIAIANNASANAVAASTTAFNTATTANGTANAAATAANTATANVATLTTSLAGKAALAGATFSGPVLVPTGTLTTHAVNKGQMDTAISTAVAAVGSGLPTTTTFNTAIPFDSYRSMGETTVSTALAFTINSSGAVDAGETILSLVADGVHVPTFAAGINLAGTQAYDNTAGRVNNITFFRDFGRYYYGVVPGPIIAAPTLLAAAVGNSTPGRIDLTWSQPMNSTISAFSAFAVSSGHTLTAHTYDDSTHTHLTTSANFVNGEAARTLSYTQPGSNKMMDLASGNLVVTFSGASITNNVSDTTAPTFVSAAVQNAAPTIVEVNFSEALLGYPSSGLPASSAFTVSGHTVSAIAWGSAATQIKLTVDAFAASESRTLAYTQPGSNNVSDPSGNLVANFSGQSITDNVSGVSDVRMNQSVGAGVVETGTGPYTYASSSSTECGAGSAQFAYSTKTLASSTDGYILATVSESAANGQWTRSVGFTAEGVGGGLAFTQPYCLTTGSSIYGIQTTAVGQTGTVNGASSRAVAIGDYMRVRRSGSNIICEVSSDSGSTYTTIHTFSSASTGTLTAMVGVGGTANSPKIVGTRSDAMA